MKKRSIIEILCDSLADKPHCSINHSDLHHTISNKRLPQPLPLPDNAQIEVRYKLLIDPSEDDSIVQLVFMFVKLNRENTRTYMCSDFFGDGQLQKVSLVVMFHLFICKSF